ncbi:non-homologous end-joining DNA ligase [Bacillota bacterium Meth-B3]
MPAPADMDLFETKDVRPMLIGEAGPAFDSPEYIYELKLDGVRCVAYLGDGRTELRNKRLINVTNTYPELGDMHQQVNARCILDGEVFVMKDGRPFFAEIQRRALMSDRFKIALAAKQLPVSFTAFDILYRDGEDLMHRPLIERKRMLSETVSRETDRFAVSRVIENNGVALYNLTVEQGLEGIVAKRKDSLYRVDKRTRDWIKCKNLLDDDFVVCGYIEKERGVVSIVTGQYDEGELVYKGHVTLGVSGRDFQRIRDAPRRRHHPFAALPEGNETAVWIQPDLVCTVEYMEKTSGGGLRQPVFKGLRDDKAPEECTAL